MLDSHPDTLIQKDIQYSDGQGFPLHLPLVIYLFKYIFHVWQLPFCNI